MPSLWILKSDRLREHFIHIPLISLYTKLFELFKIINKRSRKVRMIKHFLRIICRNRIHWTWHIIIIQMCSLYTSFFRIWLWAYLFLFILSDSNIVYLCCDNLCVMLTRKLVVCWRKTRKWVTLTMGWLSLFKLLWYVIKLFCIITWK